MGAPPKPWPLYRLADLSKAGTVVVVEGERKADLLAKHGIVATSFSGGAGTPPANTDCSPLAGRNVVLWPDAGDAGRAFMQKVASQLSGLNPAPRISMIEPSVLGLTGKVEGQPPKDDVVDYVRMLRESGIADADILRKLLEALDTAKTKSPLSGLSERYEHIAAGTYRCVDFPMPILTDATQALLPGRITLLAGTVGANKSLMVLQWMLFWLRQAAASSSSIRVTAATRVGRPWEADLRFLQAVDKTVKSHGCSVILISHPAKGVSEPTRETLAGGACYERFCSTVLTLHNHPDKVDPVRQGPGTVETTYNRTLRIEKAGDSWGTCMKLAYQFDADSLTVGEIGVIVKTGKRRGSSEPK